MKLFKNKKGEGIKDLFFGAIVMAILAFACVGIVSNAMNNNAYMQDTPALTKFNDSFNKQAEIIAHTQSLSATTSNSSIEAIPILGPAAGLISTTWAYLRGIGSSFGFITQIFTDMSSSMGIEIPAIIGQLIVAAIIFTIGFVLLGLIFKWWI